ncbi:mandelate racemase/muconate lactonizing enzyme family protein [Variovorax humicola]|uniref:Mandelate racemase/muconate lactonizing enzyme family protein n=1 Tax=Variovorax humicola TaxID=1769758 RepID=A0ABU8W476_9BURK
MSRITHIEITHHQLVLDPPFPASWDTRPRTHFPATVLRVHDDEGRTGIGSGDAMYGFSDYAHLFIGTDPLDLERHHAVLMNIEFHAGRPWPMDVALWDLAGKVRNEPVWRMLGGHTDRLRAYVSSGVHRPVEDMVRVAQQVVQAGFPALKVRFGRPRFEDDLAVVQAIHEAVGDRLELMVDCNQGWRMPWDTAQPWTLGHALVVARQLEQLGVYWMEEPLHRGDYEGLRALRKQVGIRVAGGEMTREPYEFRELLERDCLDVFQPDAVCSGGITGLAKVARAVAAQGRIFTPHTWGNGIGLMANLQLTAGTVGAPFIEWPLDAPEWSAERRDYMLTHPLRPDGQGWFHLPQTPGLGIELDEAALARTLSSAATFH